MTKQATKIAQFKINEAARLYGINADTFARFLIETGREASDTIWAFACNDKEPIEDAFFAWMMA